MSTEAAPVEVPEANPPTEEPKECPRDDEEDEGEDTEEEENDIPSDPEEAEEKEEPVDARRAHSELADLLSGLEPRIKRKGLLRKAALQQMINKGLSTKTVGGYVFEVAEPKKSSPSFKVDDLKKMVASFNAKGEKRKQVPSEFLEYCVRQKRPKKKAKDPKPQLSIKKLKAGND
jgi:hypothetical protein